MAEKRKVDLYINGIYYNVITDETEAHVREVARYVSEKLKNIENANPKLTSTMSAILTALNIAGEYFDYVDTVGDLRKKAREYSEELEQLKAENAALKESENTLSKKLNVIENKLNVKEKDLDEFISNFEPDLEEKNVTFDELK